MVEGTAFEKRHGAIHREFESRPLRRTSLEYIMFRRYYEKRINLIDNEKIQACLKVNLGDVDISNISKNLKYLVFYMWFPFTIGVLNLINFLTGYIIYLKLSPSEHEFIFFIIFTIWIKIFVCFCGAMLCPTSFHYSIIPIESYSSILSVKGFEGSETDFWGAEKKLLRDLVNNKISRYNLKKLISLFLNYFFNSTYPEILFIFVILLHWAKIIKF